MTRGQYKQDHWQEYRLYILDARGVLQAPFEFEAANDAIAVAMAEQRGAEAKQMELWKQGRKVRCWDFAAPLRSACWQ